MYKFYINSVGFPTTTINEFRDKRYGRESSTHHTPHHQLSYEGAKSFLVQNIKLSKSNLESRLKI